MPPRPPPPQPFWGGDCNQRKTFLLRRGALGQVTVHRGWGEHGGALVVLRPSTRPSVKLDMSLSRQSRIVTPVTRSEMAERVAHALPS